jgi:hypothetical protein
MSSKKRVEMLDFDAALSATPADVEAQWQARKRNHLLPQEYLEFLLAFEPMHPADRRTRNTPEDEPFEL